MVVFENPVNFCQRPVFVKLLDNVLNSIPVFRHDQRFNLKGTTMVEELIVRLPEPSFDSPFCPRKSLSLPGKPFPPFQIEVNRI